MTEIKVPSVGESVTQGTLAQWLKADGDYVEEGSDLLELETDKATVTVPAPASGVLHIRVAAASDVTVGAIVGAIDTEAPRPAAAPAPKSAAEPRREAAAEKPASPAAAPASAAAAPRPAPLAHTEAPRQPTSKPAAPPLSPSVKRIVAEAGISADEMTPTGPRGRITKEDALKAATSREPTIAAPPQGSGPVTSEGLPSAGRKRVPLSTIRKRIAERLVEAQRNTAYLTTFNEVDMEKVSLMRSRYREEFEKDHGVKLGFMSFFVKACCIALKEMPDVNAMIEGDEIVYNDHCHVGVAVSTERGLLVPVIRQAESKSLAELETTVADLATRARERKILPDELAGGTFTITNGGIFGSLLSTPLPAYPQTAILGMHAIQRRPVVVGSQAAGDERVVIKPMMYVALTYDHRLIDGKDAVTFLRRVKELVEEPDRLLLEV